MWTADVSGTIHQSCCGKTLQGLWGRQKEAASLSLRSCLFWKAAQHEPKKSSCEINIHLIQGIGREDGRQMRAEKHGPAPQWEVGFQPSTPLCIVLQPSTPLCVVLQSEQLQNGRALLSDICHSLDLPNRTFFSSPTPPNIISHLNHGKCIWIDLHVPPCSPVLSFPCSSRETSQPLTKFCPSLLEIHWLLQT